MKINYIFFYFLTSISICSAFKIHEYFVELNSDFRAENIIYNLLKEKPLKKDVNFVFAPWPILEINTRLNKKPNIDDLIHLKFENAFTVCSFDNYENLLPFFKSIGINVVFSSSGNNTKFNGIDIITIPYYARNGIKPSSKKDLLYSFIGNIHSAPCRKKLFSMAHPNNTVIIRREIFHYATRDQNLLKQMEEEYADVLSRSRYSLCPRGFSAGTYRFWESLQAGAIPVVMADDYKFPPGFDWDSCVIKVKEEDIQKVASIVLRVPKDVEERLRKNCYKAYEYYSGNNFDKIIRRYYKDN